MIIKINKPCYNHSILFDDITFFLDDIKDQEKILLISKIKEITPALINKLNPEGLLSIHNILLFEKNYTYSTPNSDNIFKFFQDSKETHYLFFLDFLELILYELKDLKVDYYDCETCGTNEYLEYYLKK